MNHSWFQLLGLLAEQVTIDERHALCGVKAHMQVDSAEFTRHRDGSIDVAALNYILMFASLPRRSRQEAVLCRLGSIIEENNLTSESIQS